jgi:PPM family protein phosphatase
MPDVGARQTCHVHALTHAGLERRNNEDAVAIADLSHGVVVDVGEGAQAIEVGMRGLLLIVSDGMGGANAGEIASAVTIETVCDAMMHAEDGAPDVALSAAVERANTRVHALATEPGREGMGATAVAIVIQGGHAYIAEVGDSRAYVLRQGQLVQLTKDQTFMQVLLDAGAIEPASVGGSEARNVILQAVGLAPAVVVAMRRLELRNADRLLLCSDGLSSYVPAGDIEEALGSAASPEEAAHDLVLAANTRGGHDNVTVIVCDVAWAALPSPRQDEEVTATLQTIRPFSFGAEKA